MNNIIIENLMSRIESVNLLVTISSLFILSVSFAYLHSKGKSMLQKLTKSFEYTYLIIAGSILAFLINHFNYYSNLSTSYAVSLSVLLILFYYAVFYTFHKFIFRSNKDLSKLDKFVKVVVVLFIIATNVFIYQGLSDKISDVNYIPKTEVDNIVKNFEDKVKQADSTSQVLTLRLDSLEIKEKSLLEQRLILINKLNSLPKSNQTNNDKFIKEFLDKYKNLY
jgi:hypothetical protein